MSTDDPIRDFGDLLNRLVGHTAGKGKRRAAAASRPVLRIDVAVGDRRLATTYRGATMADAFDGAAKRAALEQRIGAAVVAAYVEAVAGKGKGG